MYSYKLTTLITLAEQTLVKALHVVCKIIITIIIIISTTKHRMIKTK